MTDFFNGKKTSGMASVCFQRAQLSGCIKMIFNLSHVHFLSSCFGVGICLCLLSSFGILRTHYSADS